MYALTPTFDALMTLRVVKPYRNAFLELKKSVNNGVIQILRKVLRKENSVGYSAS